MNWAGVYVKCQGKVPIQVGTDEGILGPRNGLHINPTAEFYKKR